MSRRVIFAPRPDGRRMPVELADLALLDPSRGILSAVEVAEIEGIPPAPIGVRTVLRRRPPIRLVGVGGRLALRVTLVATAPIAAFAIAETVPPSLPFVLAFFALSLGLAVDQLVAIRRRWRSISDLCSHQSRAIGRLERRTAKLDRDLAFERRLDRTNRAHARRVISELVDRLRAVGQRVDGLGRVDRWPA